MDEREQRIFALEAEVLALTNSLAEVCRRLAAISPRHGAAVRGGLDGAFCNLSQARDDALGADTRHMFDYATKCVDWHRLLALAPREGATERCGEAGYRTAPEAARTPNGSTARSRRSSRAPG